VVWPGKWGPACSKIGGPGGRRKKKRPEFEFDNSKVFKFDSFKK
jgi:hypothetical protein